MREDLVPARAKSALLAGRVPAPPRSEPPPPFHPSPPSRPLLWHSPEPYFYFTFLGSYHEPPGMIRNTWPLGAAGAQEIRTLKLEKNQGRRRLGKKRRFRGGSGGSSFVGASPLLPRAGYEFPACCRHPEFTGHWGVH